MIEDFGCEELAKHVVKPLEVLKFADQGATRPTAVRHTGGSAKDAGLDGQVIKAPKLEAIADRKYDATRFESRARQRRSRITCVRC